MWYSGRPLGYNGPLASLRMKLWRRGSYDADYLKLAEKQSSREQVLAIVHKLCQYKKTHPKYKIIDFPYPNNNPHDYEIARLKLASLITGKQMAGPHEFLGPIPGHSPDFIDQIQNY